MFIKQYQSNMGLSISVQLNAIKTKGI